MSLFGLFHYFVPIKVSPSLGVFHFNLPPLFLKLILIRLRLRHRRLPCAHQVKYRLFPPPHLHPCPSLPLRRLTQVHNWLHQNILRECIPTLMDVGFHWLKPCLLSYCLRQGVLPPLVQYTPWQPPCQSLCHLVLENPQDLSHAGVTTHVFATKRNTDWAKDFKKILTTAASPPPCSGSSTFSAKPPAPLSGFGSPTYSHNTPPIVLSPGI